MRLDFEVELPDAPGELSRVLQVVANHGGNIHSVVHRHELARDNRVPVAISIEVSNQDSLKLLDALARTHRILRVNRQGGPVSSSLLLVGHVFEADVRKLLDVVFEHGAEVNSIDSRIAGRANPSAVLVRLSAEDDTKLREAIDAFQMRAEAAKLVVYEQVRGDNGA